jgi:hypothetical protein
MKRVRKAAHRSGKSNSEFSRLSFDMRCEIDKRTVEPNAI